MSRSMRFKVNRSMNSRAGPSRLVGSTRLYGSCLEPRSGARCTAGLPGIRVVGSRVGSLPSADNAGSPGEAGHRIRPEERPPARTGKKTPMDDRGAGPQEGSIDGGRPS